MYFSYCYSSIDLFIFRFVISATFVFRFLFFTLFLLVCDQAGIPPHTHGRGVADRNKGRHRAPQKNHRIHESNKIKQPDVIHSSNGQQGARHPLHRSDKSDSSRLGGDRFRPPHKRKN